MASKFDGADCSWPSAEELKQVEQIREICKAELAALPERPRDVVGDIRVCRYLRFYGHKVPEAAKGFADFLKWRVEENIDALRKGVIDLEPDDFHAWLDSVRSPYSPVLVPGFAETEEGHTVIFASPGYFKAQEFVSKRPACHTLDNDLMLVRVGMEWMMKRVDDNSYKKHRMLYSIKVIDAIHLGKETLPIRVYEIRKFAQDNAKGLMTMYCDHDILLLVVNAPWIIRFVLMFATTFMSKRQSARIKVVGSASEADVQAQLRLVGPASMFPPSLGGTKKPEEIPLYLPLAHENVERMEKWMAKTEAGISRKGVLNPPAPKDKADSQTAATPETPIVNSEPKEPDATELAESLANEASPTKISSSQPEPVAIAVEEPTAAAGGWFCCAAP
mmetsp:Transcript_47218/g.110421  ORF Transcript_47218/g.110421 Transcript_47218/m.110421 type:complete len:390 (+) Transcript_47218:50-1219(+)